MSARRDLSRRVLLGAAAAATLHTPANAAEQDFAVGQEWEALDLPDSSAVIGRIDDIGGQRIFHVILLLDAMPEYGDSENSGSMWEHTAFTEAAFAASIGRLIEQDSYVPDSFERAHEHWLMTEAYVVNITIAQYVRLIRSERLRRTT